MGAPLRNALLAPFLSMSLLPVAALPQTARIDIKVQTHSPVHTMRGGLGASWHAIRKEGVYKDSDWDYPARALGARGSALQGNPPLENEKAWQQLYRHASWLGLSWMRVELSQLMYEPERGKFDWENEEMQALYRILSWCQQNNAEVFLQQMWTEVEWNSYPGVHPLISAPRSLPDYADGLATLVDYLVNKKKFSCIRWVCITNEPPGGTWGYWWTTGSFPCVPVTSGFKAVRAEFDRRGLRIPISGPDWTDLPEFDKGKIDFDDYVGAYDIHSYQGVDAKGEQTLSRWADWAHSHRKPFFLTEFGNMRLGWQQDNPGPRSFAAALSNAETILRGLRAGVDAFNRWSFVNRGDLDGQWQLVRTFDIKSKVYLTEVLPEPVAYYGYGIITRFLSKYSSRLKDEVLEGGTTSERILSVSMRSPAGNLTTYLLNSSDSPVEATIRYDELKKSLDLAVYQVTEAAISDPGYEMEPSRTVSLAVRDPEMKESLPPRSITAVTSYRLRHVDNGIVSDPRR